VIAINPEPMIGMPGTLIGIVRNPHSNIPQENFSLGMNFLLFSEQFLPIW
jgi:hypothetical protein